MKPTFKLLLLAIPAIAANAYADPKLQDTQTLRLSAADLDLLKVDVSAGKLDITGEQNLNEIIVIAEIYQDKPLDNFELSLENTRSNDAKLITKIKQSGLLNSWNNDTRIDLTVRMPANLDLRIDDGSGSIQVNDTNGELDIDDGSGSILVDNVLGDVSIEDGSGSITISNLGGHLEINDGSGSIDINNVIGTVTVWDGSGSIDVQGAGDFVLKDDGSGSVNIENIQTS